MKPPERDGRHDGLRDTIELLASVAILVVLFKAFLVDLFVIPTGSMATTLYGYHVQMTCAQCRYPDVVNAGAGDDDSGMDGFWCANCQAYNRISGGAP